jgi:predicted enzyme related to lactoylglutathione lyase
MACSTGPKLYKEVLNMQMRAKPVIYSVPSNDVNRSRELYSRLLGVDLVVGLTSEFQSYNGPISEDGIDISVSQRHTQQETPFMYFAVENLSETLSDAERLGSSVVWGPAEIEIDREHFKTFAQSAGLESSELERTVSLGRGAVLVDPGGSQFGLMQLAKEIHEHFKLGGNG